MTRFEIELQAERLRELKAILANPEEYPDDHKQARAERSRIFGRLFDAKQAENAAKTNNPAYA